VTNRMLRVRPPRRKKVSRLQKIAFYGEFSGSEVAFRPCGSRERLTSHREDLPHGGAEHIFGELPIICLSVNPLDSAGRRLLAVFNR